MRFKNKCIFITGTDTNIGKSIVTAALALKCFHRGERTSILKSIETGLSNIDGVDTDFYRNVLPQGMDVKNIYAFHAPLSPHVAARMEKKKINSEYLCQKTRDVIMTYDRVFIEGVGGVMAPLTSQYFVCDYIKDLGVPAILICANRLGTLNHSLLSVAALRAKKIPILGFIVNHTQSSDNDMSQKTNVEELKKILRIPFLGVMPFIFGPVNEAKLLRAVKDIEI